MRHRELVTLCLTEVTSWGVLYYAFPVLLTDISASTGWSRSSVTGAFSGGLLAAAVVGIPVGRWLDRWGPRWVMAAGSLVAAPALVMVAIAPSMVWFALAWVLAGIAMAAVLYQPAFAALTRWYGRRRVFALTTLTLAGGLASTVFAPLTAMLSAHLDWRQSYLVLAAILAVITVPGHLWGLRRPWPAAPDAGSHLDHDKALPGAGAGPEQIVRTLSFAALVIALALAAFATFAALISLVPLLTERGLSHSTAALALGLGGAGQVVGRIGYSALSRRTGVRSRAVLTLLTMSITTAVLAVLTSAPALVLMAVVAGAARGVFTLVQATAVSDRWGIAHYGRLSGLLSAPLTVTLAIAPWAGTVIAERLGDYSTAFLVFAAVNLLGAAFALGSVPHHPSQRRKARAR